MLLCTCLRKTWRPKTHDSGSRSSQIWQQVAALHQFEDDELRIVVEADSEQLEDVFVLEVAHQQRLLQKLVLLALARVLVQRLYPAPASSVKLGPTFDIRHWKKSVPIDKEDKYDQITDNATYLQPKAFVWPISSAIFQLPVSGMWRARFESMGKPNLTDVHKRTSSHRQASFTPDPARYGTVRRQASPLSYGIRRCMAAARAYPVCGVLYRILYRIRCERTFTPRTAGRGASVLVWWTCIFCARCLYGRGSVLLSRRCNDIFTVLWMTSRSRIMGPMLAWRYRSSTAAMWCTSKFLTPLLRALVESSPRQRRTQRLDESVLQGLPGWSMRCIIALLILDHHLHGSSSIKSS